MTPERAKAHAIALMTQHGLIAKGWEFGFNNRKRALGLTRYKRVNGVLTLRRIELSVYFLPRVSDAETVDTIKHEIAHALCVEEHGLDDEGHGPKWRAMARRVGAKDQRVFDGEVKHRYNYVLKYGDEVVAGYFKLPKKLTERLPRLSLRGRPETKGKLKLFKILYK